MIGNLTQFYSLVSKLAIIKHRSEETHPTLTYVRSHDPREFFKRWLERIKQLLLYNTLWLDKNPFRNNMYLIHDIKCKRYRESLRVTKNIQQEYFQSMPW